jgi:hypothetical protein
MARILNRTTKQLLNHVNTPDYSEADWIINPDLSSVELLPAKYWKITEDVVSEMSNDEKDTVDNALLPSAKLDKTNQFVIETRAYINNAYAPERQQTLAVLRSEALQNIYSIDSSVFDGVGLNDAISSGVYAGYYNLPLIEVIIDSTGEVDTFTVKNIGITISTNNIITGNDQDLIDGVKIKFTNVTGHTLNDKFIIRVKRTNRINRANYIGQVLVWVMNCLSYHYTKIAEISAATTLVQCENITWDFLQFDATNPQATIQTALGIQN